MVQVSAIASEYTNLTLNPLASSGLRNDGRVLAHGRNEADNVANVDMSFSDLLDVINPLQHIPILSSIYRAVTGETIHPVSRIAGDALYGGALGLVSAGISAVGAIADEAFAASNDGKTVFASIFGDDAKTPSTELADGSTKIHETQTANKEPQEPTPVASVTAAAPIPAAQPTIAVTQATTLPSTTASAHAPSAIGKSFPLDRSKEAYGGVMDTAMMQSAQQNQSLAMALAGKDAVLQSQRALRNNRFNVAMASPSPATATAQTEPQTQAALQNLLQEVQASKGLSQYQAIHKSAPFPGETLSVTN